MKLVTARSGERMFLGGAAEDGIVDLQRLIRRASDLHLLASMRSLIEGGERALDLARDALERGTAAGRLLQLDQLHLFSPLPDPAALRCCSVFPGHYRNARRTVSSWLTGSPADAADPPPAFYAMPGYYKGNHLNITGPDAEIPWPAYAKWLDFELELALIVGSDAIDTQADDWRRHVFGWSIYNDVSARYPLIDEVGLGTGPAKGKDFDGANILGPCIVTADAFDGARAHGEARVNGETWGSADSSEMAHDWGAILAHRSRAERLHPGEIITSGCFTGCSGIDHDRPPRPGDLIELEIEGIGVLRNRITGGIA
jgi:2-keto-4-pentenoate hydratase/2-oxohepta-3-ene-1,7-dioic acid hydratase in catechol pathway